MTDDQQRARELPIVARLYERQTSRCTYRRASVTRADGEPLVRLADAQEAITAALRAAPEGLIEQHARDSQELRRLCQSRDFYKLRCEALQAVQSSMRNPERKAVCDILANGSTSALAARPQGVK